MQLQLVLLGLLLSPLIATAITYNPSGDCKKSLENTYTYTSTEKIVTDSTKITCTVIVTCESAGDYGGDEAMLYSLKISDIDMKNDAFDDDEEESNTNEGGEEGDESDGDNGSEDDASNTFSDLINGWFKFVQIADGSIPAVFHPNSDDPSAVNFKKTITAAFQANFKGTETKMEADPQSIHISKYTYEASAQDMAQGTVTMHRTIDTAHVEDYSTHIPSDVATLDKEEDLVFNQGVLTSATGVTTVKMLPESDSESDAEGDSLEAEMARRKKRNIDMSEFFDFVSKEHDESEKQENEPDYPSGPESDGGVANTQEDDDSLSYSLYGDESDDDSALEENYVSDVDGSDAFAMKEESVTMEEEEEEDEPSYDTNVNIPDFDAQATYTLELVGQRKLLSRERRLAVNHLELPEATQSTLMGHFDQAAHDMQKMKTLRSQLQDVSLALDKIHKDPEGTSSTVHKIVELVFLEGRYGSLSGYTPVINAVITYLKQLVGSVDERDCQMRASLYLMLSRDGGCDSQKALIESLDSAVNEDERRTVVVYIAFTEHPQPEMVSQLEQRIGHNVDSTDSLLLAYGALVARASPELQQRMTLFLMNRLPHAETNTSSLTHHILSLGNTESGLTTQSLIDYLHHPDESVQITSIHALRYSTGSADVQKALGSVVSQLNVSDEHISAVIHCLLYGIEHASNTHTPAPFNLELAVSLLSSVMGSDDSELHESMVSYLHLIGTEDSLHLLSLMSVPLAKNDLSNSTRLRRGSDWDEAEDVFDLVASLKSRKNDVKYFPKHIAYIWGKKFGIKKANIQVAAGGFIGAGKPGQYKVFGRAKAVAHLFGKTKTGLDFFVLREKRTSYTRVRLYAQIVGKTLADIDVKSASAICRTYKKNLFNSNRYLLLNLVYPVPILLTTIEVGVKGYVRLNSDLYVEFCEKTHKVTAEAGVESTITMEVEAGVTGSIAKLVRGGVAISGVFNYKLTPALSTEICLSKIKVKNCIGIYHQWNNNKISINVWWQRKKCKKWGIPPLCKTVWGPKKTKSLASWSLGSKPKKALWKKCDKSFICSAPIVTVKPVFVGAPGLRGPPGLRD